MALTLTSSDLSRIRAVQEVILAPLAEPSLAAWGRRVIRALSGTLGAESGIMLLPFSDTPIVEEGVGGALDETFAHYVVRPQAASGPFPDPTMEFCTQVRLARGVHALSYARIDHFLGGDLKRRSPFYHDSRTAHPHQDIAVLVADLVRGGERVEGAVHLYFESRSAFGDETLYVQELLIPALTAGVATALDLRARRAALDALAAPLMVCDVDGRVVHETAALGDVLADDDGATHVRAEALRLAADLRAPGLAPSPERSVRTGRGTYGLRATLLPEGAALGPRPSVLVAVTPPPDPWPSSDALRRRFGLTRREAEVALLLARGAANDAVADSLCISPHTARRHTERVLAKLLVSSRSQVAAAVLSPGRPAG